MTIKVTSLALAVVASLILAACDSSNSGDNSTDPSVVPDDPTTTESPSTQEPDTSPEPEVPPTQVPGNTPTPDNTPAQEPDNTPTGDNPPAQTPGDTPTADNPPAQVPDNEPIVFGGPVTDGVSSSSPALANTTGNTWFQEAAATLGARSPTREEPGRAKNVILFVGDGMGISTVTAARILEGQQQGGPGEDHVLSFGSMPYAGLVKTYNVDAQTPDSAGTMTALVTGVKTDVGVIGVGENVTRQDCSTQAGNELTTALELAEIAGMSTGIVSTARITHATPGSTYAKSVDRGWEDISDMTEAAIAEGCIDIATQLVNFETLLEGRYPGLDVNGLEVVMGGGRRHFLPNDPAFNSGDGVSPVEGDRTDGVDLTARWQELYSDGAFVIDSAGFAALDTETTPHLFALFNESHMQYEQDRANDIAGEPSLSEMTRKAIGILDNNPNGYFLTVESGRIDHAHHGGNAHGALIDTIEFARAVKVAMDATNPADTLIIVTADHSHVFTIAGYPKRGNPILGKVVPIGQDGPALAADNMPYTTLGYTNGRGFRNLGSETDADITYIIDIMAGRVDLTNVDTTAPGFFQETLIPLVSETHAGEDVGVYASGPGASLVSGTNEQSVIFHVMDYAAQLVNRAEAALGE